MKKNKRGGLLISKLIAKLQESKQCGTSIGKNTSDQWNRLDNPEINPHIYSKFNKGIKTTLWGKSSLSTNDTGKAGYSYGKA